MHQHTLQQRYRSWYRSFPKYSKASIKLHRMQHLLERLGHPERDLPLHIQVVGTNGKGSTVAAMESVLSAAGYRVGVFSSPAFVSESEQIRLGTHFLAPDVFEEQLRLLEPVLKAVEEELQERPTRFEVMTLLAVLLFRHWKIDVALFEAGLGGKYDSTSALGAQMVACTNVSRDHMAILGNTIHEIARDKAHAIREGTQHVTSTVSGAAQSFFAERAQKIGATWSSPRLAMTTAISPDGTIAQIATPQHIYRDLAVNLVGVHQAQNVALALTTLEAAARLGDLSLSERAVRRGCQQIVHPGRFQLISPDQFEEPLPQPVHLVLDGAHNEESMRVLLGTALGLHPTPPIAVFATKNRSRDGFLELLQRAEHVYLPRITLAPWFRSPQELLHAAPQQLRSKLTLCTNTEEALFLAAQHAEAEARDLLVTGSLYFLGVLYAREPRLFPPAYSPAMLPLLTESDVQVTQR